MLNEQAGSIADLDRAKREAGWQLIIALYGRLGAEMICARADQVSSYAHALQLLAEEFKGARARYDQARTQIS